MPDEKAVQQPIPLGADKIIRVDSGLMTYRDLRLLLKWQDTANIPEPKDEDAKKALADQQSALFSQVLTMLDKVVIGGIDDLPIDAMPDIITALGAAMNRATAGKQAKN